MSTELFESRLSIVEAELARLRSVVEKTQEPWWKSWAGAFLDDPMFEKAMEYGREWRKSQKPKRKSKKSK